MTPDDLESSEGVTVGKDGTYLRLAPPRGDPSDPKYLRLPVQIETHGLVASAALELNGWGGWVPGLTDYLDALAASWRGWEGEKTWHDDSGAVAFSATHNGMSTVSLTVFLRPSFGALTPGAWESRIVVPIEAGRLSHFASEVRALCSRLPR